MSTFDVLEQLESHSGRLDKEAILRANINNDLLRRVFIAALDPYVVYYINKFRMPKAAQGAQSDDDAVVEDFLAFSQRLSTREITGNTARDDVERFFARLTLLQQKWCQRILLKNLRCGVQESTVNKVWPGSINSFAVALACTLKSEFVRGEGIKILDEVSYPVRVEPKLDGLRCIAVKQGGVVTFYTRNGTVLETLPTIKAELEQASYDDVVLDGEAMGKDWSESASVLMARKSKHDDSNIVYNVFDAMPLRSWVEQACPMTYKSRLDIVSMVIASLAAQSEHVKPVPHIVATSEDELKSYFAKCMDAGFEGVMLKTVDTPYVFKRSENILKLKPCVTYEGVIVDHYEGRRGTKREGLFGGFGIVLPNGVVTRLGGGYSDALKADIQLHGPDTYLGKIVEIEAQPDPLTPDGLTSDGKARFPVFMRFRSESDVDPKVIAAGTAWFEDASHDAKEIAQ